MPVMCKVTLAHAFHTKLIVKTYMCASMREVICIVSAITAIQMLVLKHDIGPAKGPSLAVKLPA
jgi:hypothetical protein